MKTLILTITMLVTTGCTNPPDFSNPAKVVGKESFQSSAKYSIRLDQGSEETFYLPSVFYAPDAFADVGDVIVFHRGALAVKKDTWKY